VARDVIRAAVGNVFNGYFANADLRQVTEWFDLGGTLQIDDTLAAEELLARTGQVQGLRALASEVGVSADAAPPLLASAVDFVLEGLYAQKKISRSDEYQYQSAEPIRRPSPRGVAADPLLEREIPNFVGKKKYYN
jgi:magnesium chelatase subunit I